MQWPICRSVFAIPAFALVFLASPATAAVEGCRTIEDDTRRLVCYDRQGTSARVERPAPANRQPVALRVFSREVVSCGRSFDSRVIMRLRCEKNATGLTFGTLCHATRGGRGSYRTAAFRLDSSRARPIAGKSTTDRRSRPLWVASNPKAVLKRMLGKSKMVVRITPVGANAFNATFNISKLSDTINPVLRSCGL